MKSNIECPYCEGIAAIKTVPEEIAYKKGKFNVKANFYKCEKCQEEFTTTETDTFTMEQVKGLFRQRNI